MIAASAGALPALLEVLAPLPADFPAAIAIVQHRSMQSPEMLIEILSRATRMVVCHATHGVMLKSGTVYVCPPGVHMSTERCLRLIDGPRVRYVRPNADVMFESVSRAYGDDALAIVLSGNGSDGAAGVITIADAGGTVLAQEASTCGFSSMPDAAVKTGAVTHVMSPIDIARALVRWSDVPHARAASREVTIARTTVVLADDERMVLHGLRVLLEGERHLHVLATVEDGPAAIRAATELRPAIIVMDVQLPAMNGAEATRRILTAAPRVKVIALSSSKDPSSVRLMLEAGASGYVTKQRPFHELVEAIDSVVAGRTYLSKDVAGATGTG
ncbi:MAG TPA: chemotaxis protein CheB [Kofleriaceae bacterium]|nr:chemotaxis protein CheB [Kofleriaceae bacterium]